MTNDLKWLLGMVVAALFCALAGVIVNLLWVWSLG